MNQENNEVRMRRDGGTVIYDIIGQKAAVDDAINRLFCEFSPDGYGTRIASYIDNPDCAPFVAARVTRAASCD